MTPKEQYHETIAHSLIKQLEQRHFEACYCATKEDACQKVLSYFTSGCSIGWGGSMTLEDIGLMDYLKQKDHDYVIYDRLTATTKEEKKEMYGKIATCDYFLMSSNAITLDGELVNIDGSGNRVACLCHGPEHVIVVVGMNKIVKDEKDAYDRIGTIAAPINGCRLQKKTPCTVTGHCSHCKSPESMCCQLVTTRLSNIQGRIKVILVGESLGY